MNPYESPIPEEIPNSSWTTKVSRIAWTAFRWLCAVPILSLYAFIFGTILLAVLIAMGNIVSSLFSF